MTVKGDALDVHAYAYVHQQEPPRPISEFSVLKKLSALNTNKVSGPDGITSWLLKENADLLAAPVADSCFLPFWSVAFQLRGRKRTLHPSRRPHLLVMLTNT